MDGFVRNKETGVFKYWKNGENLGRIYDMGDYITKEVRMKEDEELKKQKEKEKQNTSTL